MSFFFVIILFSLSIYIDSQRIVLVDSHQAIPRKFSSFIKSDSIKNDFDIIEIEVENRGNSPNAILFRFYLDDENTELLQLHAEKNGNSSHFEAPQNLETKSVLVDEELFSDVFEVGMAKLHLDQDETSKFFAAYKSVGGHFKKVNKLFAALDLNTNDPRYFVTTITSVNFKSNGYPNNSKHKWYIRCHKDYQFIFEITDFDIENEFDRLALLAVKNDGSKQLLVEVDAVGTYQTNTNQLLVLFRSDCDTSMNGFRALITTVKTETGTETTSFPGTTNGTTQNTVSTESEQDSETLPQSTTKLPFETTRNSFTITTETEQESETESLTSGFPFKTTQRSSTVTTEIEQESETESLTSGFPFETTQRSSTVVTTKTEQELGTSPELTTEFSFETTRDNINIEISHPKQDCKQIKSTYPYSSSGVYTLTTDSGKFDVFCQMEVDGGGWIVLQSRYNGRVSFKRSWYEYAHGFGAFDSEFWLGLEHVHELTKNRTHELRVDLTSFSDEHGWAKYKDFKIASSSDNYRLSFQRGSYTGNAGDALSFHNNVPFSTHDNDNDRWPGESCSDYLGGGGGNWFVDCYEQNINAVYINMEDYDDYDAESYMSWIGFAGQRAIPMTRLMFRAID